MTNKKHLCVNCPAASGDVCFVDCEGYPILDPEKEVCKFETYDEDE